MYGFVYSEGLTKKVKEAASNEQRAHIPFPTGGARNYTATHLMNTMQVSFVHLCRYYPSTLFSRRYFV